MENQSKKRAEQVKKAASILRVTHIDLKLRIGAVVETANIKELAKKVFLKIIAEDNAYGCDKLAMLKDVEKVANLKCQEFVTEKNMLGAFLHFLHLQIRKGHKVTTAELNWANEYFTSKYYLNRAKKNLYVAAVIIYGQEIAKNEWDWEISNRTMRKARRDRFAALLLKIDDSDQYGLEEVLKYANEFKDLKSQALIRKKLLAKYLCERKYEEVMSLNCSKEEMDETVPRVVSVYVNALYLRGAREIAEKFAPDLVEYIDVLASLFKN